MNVIVADRHANVHANPVMTNDNDNNADNGDLNDNIREILGAAFMATFS